MTTAKTVSTKAAGPSFSKKTENIGRPRQYARIEEVEVYRLFERNALRTMGDPDGLVREVLPGFRPSLPAPPWDRASDQLQRDFLHEVCMERGVTHALTFDLSATQRVEALFKSRTIKRWVQIRLFDASLSHIYRAHPGIAFDWWFVIETDEDVGNPIYVKVPGSNERFHIHAVLNAPPAIFPRVAAQLCKRAEMMGAAPPGRLISLRGGKRAHMQPLTDSKGWFGYGTKDIQGMLDHFADVTGARPYGVSLTLRQAAKIRYEEWRAKIPARPPAS